MHTPNGHKMHVNTWKSVTGVSPNFHSPSITRKSLAFCTCKYSVYVVINGYDFDYNNQFSAITTIAFIEPKK